MPPRRSTSGRSTATSSPRTKSPSVDSRRRASTRPSSVDAEPVKNEEEAETVEEMKLDDSDDGDDAYDPKQEKAANKTEAQENVPLPATTNASVRDHFERLMNQAKMYTDALKKGMESEETTAFSIDNQQEEDDDDDEAEAPKGKSKKRKASGKKVSPPKKKAKQGEVEAVPDTHEQSKLVSGGTLKDFQKAGVDWLIARHMNASGCLLADEMGTGKTIQTIAFLAFLRENGIHGFNLVVVPRAVLGNWEIEFARFAPSMPILVYQGTPPQRKALREEMRALAQGDAEHQPTVITTYDFARRDKNLLARATSKDKSHFAYQVLVIDEAQNIKSASTKTHQALKLYEVDFRILLTGTPLQNNLDELYALLSFILPDVFSDAAAWSASFNFDSLTSADGTALSKADEFALLVAQLHLILKPFMLRRLKKDVQKDLPLKKEYLVPAPMTERQRELDLATRSKRLRALFIDEATKKSEAQDEPAQADAVVQDEPGQTISQRAGRRKSKGKQVYEELTDEQFFDDAEAATAQETQTAEEVMEAAQRSNKKKIVSKVNNLRLDSAIMSLRLIANHPMTANKTGLEDGDDAAWARDVIAESGKMQLLDRMLPKLFADGHKVLIFSQFTTMLSVIGRWADEVKGWGYYQIGGGQPADQEQINDFNTDTSEDSCKLFLLSTRAGGVGLNLVGADTVIIFDSDWNPQNDLQAMDRAHRIGQTKPVLVFRFETENSIDGLIIERATRKRKLEKVVLGEGTFKGTEDDTNDVLAKAKGKAKSTKTKTENQKQMEELARRLLATEGQKIDFDGERVLSDEQLDQLFDRSEATMTSKGVPASTPSKKRKGKTAPIFTAMQTVDDEDDEATADPLATVFDVEGELSAREAREAAGVETVE